MRAAAGPAGENEAMAVPSLTYKIKSIIPPAAAHCKSRRVRGGDGKAGDGNGKNSKAQTCAKGVRPGERTKKLLIFGRSDRAFVQNPQIPVEFLRVPADFFMIFMNCFPESDLL